MIKEAITQIRRAEAAADEALEQARREADGITRAATARREPLREQYRAAAEQKARAAAEKAAAETRAVSAEIKQAAAAEQEQVARRLAAVREEAVNRVLDGLLEEG